MEEGNKLPLKRVELSLTKFNEVAIPHHLDLLRQHKTNIIKYESTGQLRRARSEQAAAGRAASQLRALLAELDALRRRVREQERHEFDALTQRSRELTLKAIVDYLDTSPIAMTRSSSPPREVSASAVSTESVGVVAHAERDAVPLDDEPGQIQLQVDDRELQLSERSQLLRGWSELQGDVRALHDAWQALQAAALTQRRAVERAEQASDDTAVNVVEARRSLAAAERLGGAALSVGGAALGALVGGPVGLAVGVKAGALAAAAGSVLGYLGVRAIVRPSLPTVPALPAPPPTTPAPTQHDKQQ